MGRKRKNNELESGSSSRENSISSIISTNNLNGVQRIAANDRERTRMRVLSKAFVRLKTSLPWVPNDTKLSKLDTLKLATSYISYLTRILSQDEDDENEVYFQPPSNNHYSHNQQLAFSSSSSSTTTTTKMLPSIRLSAFDMQKIINEHLSSNIMTSTSASSSSMTSSCHHHHHHGGAFNHQSYHHHHHNENHHESSLMIMMSHSMNNHASSTTSYG